MKRRKTRKHWYRQYIGECPVCGRSVGWPRERVYGKKPKRNIYVFVSDRQAYCGCVG